MTEQQIEHISPDFQTMSYHLLNAHPHSTVSL